MGKALTHVIDYSNDGTDFPDWIKTVSYGKCEVSPYAESDLWFVSIPHGKHDEWKADGKDIDELITKYNVRSEKIYPEQDTTFLVTEDYARIAVFNQWKRDIKAWEKVAHKIFVGAWCYKFEQLWQDVQIHEHASIKYGYCRTTKKYRDLWFVSFKDSGQGDDHTFIIDEICATPSFINHLGTNPRKWEPLCWCYLRHEIQWDNLKTGMDAKSLDRFQLDSPYSLDEINQKIKLYEDEMNNKENVTQSSKKKTSWFS